jgi:hypothetical protein
VLGFVVGMTLLGLFLTLLSVALLLGLWGEIRSNLTKLWRTTRRPILKSVAVMLVWGYWSVTFGEMSVFWAVALGVYCVLAMAAAAVAGCIFTLVIVRMLVLPSCMPERLFCMLTGTGASYLEDARQRMRVLGWRKMPVVAEDAVTIDSMVWLNPQEVDAAGPQWAIWFLGNGGHQCSFRVEFHSYVCVWGEWPDAVRTQRVRTAVQAGGTRTPTPI